VALGDLICFSSTRFNVLYLLQWWSFNYSVFFIYWAWEVHHAEKLEQQRKDEMNWKIASRKVISIVLWREVTKAVLNKRKHGKDTARTPAATSVASSLRPSTSWESALKVCPPFTSLICSFLPVYISPLDLIDCSHFFSAASLHNVKQPPPPPQIMNPWLDDGCHFFCPNFPPPLSLSLLIIVQMVLYLCDYAYKVFDKYPSRLQERWMHFYVYYLLKNSFLMIFRCSQLSIAWTIFTPLRYLIFMYDICFSLLCELHCKLSLMKCLSKFLEKYICEWLF
jgi:hypothetical protein